MKGYKGTDKDLRCRNFQYEVGKEYQTECAKTCEEGFHFCEYPLDVFSYYPPASSRFFEVEGSGDIDCDTDGSKVACTKIRIKAEIKLSGLIQAGIEYILDRVKREDAPPTYTDDMDIATNTDSNSAASNTGYQSTATNTGEQSLASNDGDQSIASNTGDLSVATNSGNRSVAINTGYGSVASNDGDQSIASNTGYHSVATNSGNRSVASNDGDQSIASNTGDLSVATNSGYHSVASNTGYQSVASNTGNQSASTVEGVESVAISLGIGGKAQGTIGCWLTLAEWEYRDNSWNRVDAQTVQVDGEVIKANTFYRLQSGEFVEAEAEAEK